MNNPFDITKAVDFTDEEIVKYWIDINDSNGFENMLKPLSLMPMILKGSKGIGKTHIMRYFSYELQKIKYAENLLAGLENDRFIGIYIRCSGFNSERFKEKGNSEEKWKFIYAYYWELWIAQILIACLIDLRNKHVVKDFSEKRIIERTLALFNRKIDESPETLNELNTLFRELQRGVDYETENCIFRRDKNVNIEILISPTKITYGLPQILKDEIDFFANKHILYLIDELENFSIPQQELIQTMIREKPTSCTFRIGARLHGVKTYYTLGGREENRKGSEYDEIILDDFLRRSNKYSNFAMRICNNRLHENGYCSDKCESIEKHMDDFDLDGFKAKLTCQKDRNSRSYFADLENKLHKIKLSDKQIIEIINNLKFDDDRIIERTNVFLFYRKWKKNSLDLTLASAEIKKMANAYHEGGKETDHEKVMEKYRLDILDTLARESRIEIPYYGFQKFVDLSCGTPRNLLNLLKYSFNWEYFDSANIPMTDKSKITIQSQSKGIKDTINWFFEENRIPSYDGRKLVDCINRLGNFLRELRFSDIPPQCSISIFTLKLAELSGDARETFKMLMDYSYLVEITDRRDKGSNEKINVYRINSTISPKWELPVDSNRGLVILTTKEADAIFNTNTQNEYDVILMERLKRYKAPFKEFKEEQAMKTLFD